MLILHAIPGEYAFCRLPAGAVLPADVWGDGLVAVVATRDETSVVAPAERVPAGTRVERGWRLYTVDGPLDFDLTGILASLTAPLSAARIPVFAISSYDTDHLLVPATTSDAAEEAWRAAGYAVAPSDDRYPRVGKPQPVLTDGVVTLRRAEVEDYEEIRPLHDDEMARRFGWWPAIEPPLANHLAAVDRWRAGWSLGRTAQFYVCRDARIMGGVEVDARGEGIANISWWTGPPFRGHGYASRAARLLARYALSDMGFRRVEARLAPDNIASAGVARRAGFVREGVLRGVECGEVWSLIKADLDA